MFDRHHRFEKWLHLYRVGELSSRQNRLLKRHLETCQTCRLQSKTLSGMETAITAARGMSPELRHGDLLIQSVMHNLHAAEITPGFWDRLAAPGIRLTAAVVLILIMSTFLIQEGHDQKRMAVLMHHNQRSQVLFVRTESLSPRLMRFARKVLSHTVTNGSPAAKVLNNLGLGSKPTSLRLNISRRARIKAAYSRMHQSGVIR
ncbi:zf-HC2 domain-containing protein [bacterium]|nr:zf-HC2 domain-containing protein [bacterium]